MTSSNFTLNDGTIWILTHFMLKHRYHKQNGVVSMILRVTCAFEVIMMPDEKVIALFLTISTYR